MGRFCPPAWHGQEESGKRRGAWPLCSRPLGMRRDPPTTLVLLLLSIFPAVQGRLHAARQVWWQVQGSQASRRGGPHATRRSDLQPAVVGRPKASQPLLSSPVTLAPLLQDGLWRKEVKGREVQGRQEVEVKGAEEQGSGRHPGGRAAPCSRFLSSSTIVCTYFSSLAYLSWHPSLRSVRLPRLVQAGCYPPVLPGGGRQGALAPSSAALVFCACASMLRSHTSCERCWEGTGGLVGRAAVLHQFKRCARRPRTALPLRCAVPCGKARSARLQLARSH